MALRWAGIGSPVKIGQLKPASSSSSADPADHIPIEADRGFRIVTAHSGLGRKSVNFEQNPRSASSRITGHVRSESAVNLVRNTHNTLKRPMESDTGPEVSPRKIYFHYLRLAIAQQKPNEEFNYLLKAFSSAQRLESQLMGLFTLFTA